MNRMKGCYAVILVLLAANVSGCSIYSEQGVQPNPTSTIFMRPIQELPTVLPPGDEWTALPPSVQDAHRTSTLSITWHNQPYPGWYDVINLRNDGRLRHWRVVEGISGQEINPAGQLTQQEVLEVQRLLEKLTTVTVVPHDIEATVVTLSFIWEGEPHYITIDQFHCTSEMVRLFEIIDGVFERHPDISRSSLNPCRVSATAEGPFTTTTISPTTHFTFSDLPDAIKKFHQGPLLIRVIWFQRSFESSYQELKIFYDRSMMYIYHLSDAQPYYQVRKGQVNDAQMQILQHLLNRMNTEENSKDVSTRTIISVGYSWKGDYRLYLFDEMDCPDELKGLFAVVTENFDMNELDLDRNAWPCQE
jgi:hypothetical protein